MKKRKHSGLNAATAPDSFQTMFTVKTQNNDFHFVHEPDAISVLAPLYGHKCSLLSSDFESLRHLEALVLTTEQRLLLRCHISGDGVLGNRTLL